MTEIQYAQAVNTAFKRSEILIKRLTSECINESMALNLTILFGQCVFALRKAGLSPDEIVERLRIEMTIYEQKQPLGGAK